MDVAFGSNVCQLFNQCILLKILQLHYSSFSPLNIELWIHASSYTSNFVTKFDRSTGQLCQGYCVQFMILQVKPVLRHFESLICKPSRGHGTCLKKEHNLRHEKETLKTDGWSLITVSKSLYCLFWHLNRWSLMTVGLLVPRDRCH